MMRRSIPLTLGIAVMLAGVATVNSTAAAQGRGGTQGRGGKAAPRPATPTPPPASAAPPQITAVGLRVTGPGLGANGTELKPFNESPGTVIALAIQPPAGSGIVDIDDHGSRLDSFADDKGLSLMEEGRVGPFPKIAEDGSVALVEVEVRARPSAGSTSVGVQGTLAIMLAGGSKPFRAANVHLDANQTFKIGATTMTLSDVKPDDDATRFTVNLPRSVLQTVRAIRFFDVKNAPIEGHRTGSGYFNEKAELELEAKTKEKIITIELELWQNLRTVKAPFNVQAGLGMAAGGRASSATGDAPASAGSGDKMEKQPAAPPKPEGPPPAIKAGEGAASPEAVVKQMQTAALAGKGAQVLSVIYPTERTTYAQGVAMAMAFMPMASMGDEKAGAAIQKELDAFFAKHKITPPMAREPDDLFKGVDVDAFVSDAMLFMKAHTKKGETPELPVPPGKPENVKITGDTAVASLAGKDVTFNQISGRWFIRLK